MKKYPKMKLFNDNNLDIFGDDKYVASSSKDSDESVSFEH